MNIDQLFATSKLLCFGRYVLTAPQEARLVWGRGPKVLPDQATDIQKILEARKKEILGKDKAAQINYVGQGPAPNTWLVRYYDDEFAPKYGLETFDVYYIVGPHIFTAGYATANSRNSTPETIASRVIEFAKSIRPRTPDEVPAEPGLCSEYGFERLAPNDTSPNLVQVGLFLPSLPDVMFSVEINDAASTQGSNGHSLTRLIDDRRKALGERYPRLTTLREGRKVVHGWDGEESLVRRADGTHDFEWLFIGQTGNVARPPRMDVTMFTKVRANRVGAAEASSLNDEEAIALWDRLLDGLKFRVGVPGAALDAVAIQ